MIRASEYIVGTFDFTSFAASDPERSARLAGLPGAMGERFHSGATSVPRRELDEAMTKVGTQSLEDDEADAPDLLSQKAGNVRTIHSSQWTRTDEEFSYTVRGDGFLHHMVRNLVGTFLQVGKGSLKPEDVPAILAARNRSAAGPTAPACGLYLVNVEYGMREFHDHRTASAARATIMSRNPATGETTGRIDVRHSGRRSMPRCSGPGRRSRVAGDVQ